MVCVQKIKIKSDKFLNKAGARQNHPSLAHYDRNAHAKKEL